MATRRLEAERTRENAETEATTCFTLADVTKLVQALEGTDVRSLVWNRNGEKVVIRRGPAPAPVTQVVTQTAPVAQMIPAPIAPLSAPVAAPAASSAAASAPAPVKAAEKPGVIVTSPFVGTFYRAPSPDSPPFVEVGSMVKKGQSLCIVEAMKLMNEIEAEVAGRVAEIYVQNATPVEFGEKLFRIEPA
jgi:acetyl-CoA carboxylase biotin carboxyl carrier protein